MLRWTLRSAPRCCCTRLMRASITTKRTSGTKSHSSATSLRTGAEILEKPLPTKTLDWTSGETLTFEDLGDGRCRIVALSVVDNMELRDMILSSGMEVGVTEGYEKLDELLAAQP